MSLNLWQVQKALYETLTADSVLMTLVTGIYDRVPERAGVPYLVIGDLSARDWSSKSGQGAKVAVVLHSFSRSRGGKSAAAIIERVRVLTHDATLSIEGKSCVVCRADSMAVMLDPDGQTEHGILRVEMLVQA